MKIMMVYDIDDRLEKMIKLRAESEGLSINKTVKKLLETALGIEPRPAAARRDSAAEASSEFWTEEHF